MESNNQNTNFIKYLKENSSFLLAAFSALIAIFVAYVKYIDYRMSYAFLSYWNVKFVYDLVSTKFQLMDIGSAIIMIVVLAPVCILFKEFLDYVSLLYIKDYLKLKRIKQENKLAKTLLDLPLKDDESKKVKACVMRNDDLIQEVYRDKSNVKYYLLLGVILIIIFWFIVTLFVPPNISLRGMLYTFLGAIVGIIASWLISKIIGFIKLLFYKKGDVTITEWLQNALMNKELKCDAILTLLGVSKISLTDIRDYCIMMFIYMFFVACLAPLAGRVSAQSMDEFGVVQEGEDNYAIVYVGEKKMIAEKCVIKDGLIVDIDRKTQMIFCNDKYVLTYYKLEQN